MRMHEDTLSDGTVIRARTTDLAAFEQLERRILLNGDLTVIQWFEADDRGNVVLQMSGALDGNTVNTNSIQLLLAGPDGLLGTADDIVVDIVVSYNADTNQIIIEGNFDESTRYAIRVNGDEIRDAKGDFIDAEFMGMGNASGDGTAGGEFLVFTRPPQQDLVARVFTTFGNIDILLFRDTTPITVANFLNYAQSGRYDETFFHRLVSDFVLQGGGFLADANFTPIQTDPAILNEFNISNTFGTIAMAKLGGNPNSATSQFFFNLADNSENLDNQNGGFTVFGEIIGDGSFDVLLALAGLTTVNATGQGGGAFNTVPVVDPDAVDGDLTPADLVVITRVSILQDVSGQPFQQLGTENTQIFTPGNAANNARVYVYDLDGLNSGTISDFVRVIFGSGNTVSAIQILDGFEGRLGISIAGADFVNVVQDLRTTEQGQLAFIAANTNIGSIFLRHSVVGMDLAGFTLAGGIQISDDPALVGSSDNRLGLYVQNGFVNSVTVLGNVEADLVLEGGTRLVRVLGQTIDSNIRIGLRDTPGFPVVTNILLRQVENAGISSSVPLNLVQATNWLTNSPSGNTITAPSLNALQILGDARNGISGDFDANLRLSGIVDQAFTLRSAIIRGSVFGSNWDIQGNTGTINTLGGVSASEFNFDGNVLVMLAGGFFGSTIDIAGTSNLIRSFEWNTSFLTTGGLVRQFLVTAVPSLGFNGTFSGEVFINFNGNPDDIMSRFIVLGDVASGTVQINANLIAALFRAETDQLTFEGAGFVRAITLIGESRESSFGWDEITNFRATSSAFDLTVNSNRINNFIVVGDVNGEISSGSIRQLFIRGDASIELLAGHVDVATITGNLIGSSITLLGSSETTGLAMRILTVGGVMSDSAFSSEESVGRITLRGLVNSDIYIGVAEGVFGLPDSPADVNLDATLGRLPRTLR